MIYYVVLCSDLGGVSFKCEDGKGFYKVDGADTWSPFKLMLNLLDYKNYNCGDTGNTIPNLVIGKEYFIVLLSLTGNNDATLNSGADIISETPFFATGTAAGHTARVKIFYIKATSTTISVSPHIGGNQYHTAVVFEV